MLLCRWHVLIRVCFHIKGCDSSFLEGNIWLVALNVFISWLCWSGGVGCQGYKHSSWMSLWIWWNETNQICVCLERYPDLILYFKDILKHWLRNKGKHSLRPGQTRKELLKSPVSGIHFNSSAQWQVINSLQPDS